MAIATSLVTLFVWTMATASPPSGAAGVPLGGLMVRLGAVRTWTSFDGKTPVAKADERWVSGAMRLVTFSDPFLGSSRLASGKRQMSQGKDSYAATLESFAKADAPRAEGRFCEVAVLLVNRGTTPVTLSLADAAVSTLDARLMLTSGESVTPRAFLVPGVGAAATSLVRSFEGKLAVALAPGEESWALLVFDVPPGQSQARLQLKKTATLPLRLP
jgi:hypothetical protein